MQVHGERLRTCEYRPPLQDGAPGGQLVICLRHLQSLQQLLDAAVPAGMPLNSLLLQCSRGLQSPALQGCHHLAGLRSLHLEGCGALDRQEGAVQALLEQASQLTALTISSGPASDGAVPPFAWQASVGGLKQLSLRGNRLAGLPDGPYLSGEKQAHLCLMCLRIAACVTSAPSSCEHRHRVPCLQVWRR
jgi:hypothetical protein